MYLPFGKEMRIYFVENEIEVIIPNEEERTYIDRVKAEELEVGIVREESPKAIDCIIQNLIDEERIQGVIFGCTELPLMYANVEIGIPCFDTLKYHIFLETNR